MKEQLEQECPSLSEVWFFAYWEYRKIDSFAFEKIRLNYSKNYESFEEAWKAHEDALFPASPVMKGYVNYRHPKGCQLRASQIEFDR